MKKIFFLILFTIVSACGYSSIYKDRNQIDLFINVIDSDGDFEINNFIRNELKILSNINSSNRNDVSFETKYEKIILAKDTTGKATDYRLDMNVKFTIHTKNNREIIFDEQFKIKNIDKSFEQLNYEKDIKRNFSKTVKDKLIMYLINIMIIKQFETNKIDLNKNKLILLYGNNEGLKRTIKNLLKKMKYCTNMTKSMF